jgi:hypothetical protein
MYTDSDLYGMLSWHCLMMMIIIIKNTKQYLIQTGSTVHRNDNFIFPHWLKLLLKDIQNVVKDNKINLSTW